jgi:hypothetical protein
MAFEAVPPGDSELEDCDPPDVGRISVPILPDLSFDPDPELVAQGWERRFMADPKQVEEATRLYSELGFEVRTERVLPSELSDLCGSCALATCHAYVTLYTRKRVSG